MQKKRKSTASIVLSLLCVGALTSSCSKPFTSEIKPVESEVSGIVCPQSYEVTLDFFSQLIAQKEDASQSVTEQSFGDAMAVDDAFKGVAGAYLKKNLYSMYLEFVQDLKSLSAFESNPDLTELVTALKVEDTENHVRKELVDKYKAKINYVSQEMKNLGYSCPEDHESNRQPTNDNKPVLPKDPASPMTDRMAVTESLIGSMKKVFAVTYQSCSVLNRKALDKDDKNMEGVNEERVGGRGLQRHITSLSAVVATHPYIQKSYPNGCFDLRKSPLIYDFGGRPNFTRGAMGELNFFSNMGGSEVLGYDCSAMVYTVLMGGGFRLKENKMFVASDVLAAQSRQFLDPDSKGWNCLDPVEFSNETQEPLLEGDIASMNGHTFMIYRVGRDPYGLSGISDCSKIDFQKFDFDIIQSSPSKDGVGVNVYAGKDYLLTTGTMRNGFVEYAKNYCERVKMRSTKKINLNYFSIVRMSTKSSCRMPAIHFQNESCVQQCI